MKTVVMLDVAITASVWKQRFDVNNTHNTEIIVSCVYTPPNKGTIRGPPPFRAPKSLPILTSSKIVPKKGFEGVKVGHRI